MLANHVLFNDKSNKTNSMSSEESKRITSHSWVPKYKREFGETPPVVPSGAIFSEGSDDMASIPSGDPDIRLLSSSRMSNLNSTRVSSLDSERIGSSSFDWLQNILSSHKALHSTTAEPVSTRDLVAATLLGDETETPLLHPEPTSEQAAEPMAMPPAVREYVDVVTEKDVLSERGGKANHHKGNKRYRKIVSEMKAQYRHINAKTAKTDLSKSIVDYVYSYGGRFLKKDKDKEGRYLVMTKAEARKKTSQALRETKLLKWTDVDMEEDAEEEY